MESKEEAFVPASSCEVKSLAEHLDRRLERITEKMDLCLEELAALKRPAVTLQTSRLSRVSAPRSPKNRKQSVISSISGVSGATGTMETSSNFQFFPPPSTKGQGVMSPGEGTRAPSSPTPTEKVAARPLSTRGLKAMDLDFARRLHAKEVCQEVKAMDDPDMKPFIRLVHHSWSDVVWELLDDPRSSRGAWCLSQVLKLLVIVSLALTTFSISDVAILEKDYKQVAQIIFDAVFFFEFLLRFATAPLKRSYVVDPINWGDMLSALGFPVLACIGFAQSLPETQNQLRAHWFLLLFLPLPRFLKLLRYFESFKLLVDAFAKSAEALPVLIYIMAFIVLLFGTSIYVAEDRTNIPSMPHSLWLALVTMTTVGYGDYYPRSLGGYLAVSALTFVSVLFLALPVGIIGHEFNKSWQRRGEMLLKTRLRNALSKWGYGFTDMEQLFEYADADEDGQLMLGEFIELIRQMRIGVTVETAAKLFHFIDANGDGFVDRIQFIRSIFPDEYAKHTQKISDESFYKTKRRIGVALERLDSSRSSFSSNFSVAHQDDTASHVRVSLATNSLAPILSDLPESQGEGAEADTNPKSHAASPASSLGEHRDIMKSQL